MDEDNLILFNESAKVNRQKVEQHQNTQLFDEIN